MNKRDDAVHAASVRDDIAAIVARARAAQRTIADADQVRADELAVAAAWAIVEPSRNRALAELAVRDTGMGDVEDKVAKNRRKTMGLLRDLAGARTAGIIAEDRERGLVEIARPVGVVAAITPSTNPGATPANNIVNALKARNAIVLAPSPKGASTLATLVGFVHAELDRVGAPRDLVQMLPAPVSREHTRELMRQADLVEGRGQDRAVEAPLAPEVVIDHRLVHTSRGGDGLDAHAVEAVRSEQLGARRQEGLAGGVSISDVVLFQWFRHLGFALAQSTVRFN